jgi:hypothetical protein
MGGTSGNSAIFYGSTLHAILTPLGIKVEKMAFGAQVSAGSGRTKAGMVRLTK